MNDFMFGFVLGFLSRPSTCSERKPKKAPTCTCQHVWIPLTDWRSKKLAQVSWCSKCGTVLTTQVFP